MANKTNAYILSKKESGESDLVVTFYSNTFGKIDLFVKSARKSKKRFQGKLENSNQYSIEFVKAKKINSLNSLTSIEQAKNIRFYEFDKSIYIYRSIILEMIDKFEIDNQPNSEVFSLMDFFYLNINSNNEIKKIKTTVKTINKYLKINGVQPTIKKCYSCKKDLINIKFFDLKNGGSVCNKCRLKNKPFILNLNKPINTKTLNRDFNYLNNLLIILLKFCEYHSGKIFNSVKYLRVI
tara:strand:+ start:8138 stop:8851 length:714 start_codon:yes stop_codon:yes gene_type:complete